MGNLCVNCRFYRGERPFILLYRHNCLALVEKRTVTSIIDGKSRIETIGTPMDAETMRMRSDGCGPEGRLFQVRTPLIQRLRKFIGKLTG